MRHLNSVLSLRNAQCISKMLCWLFCGSLMFWSAMVWADPIPDNSRILILGPGAETHAEALQGLIDGDPGVNTRGITVDHYEIADTFEHNTLLSEVYEGTLQFMGIWDEPFESNDLFRKLDEGFDIILINPDRFILQWPEPFMESVRLVQRYTRSSGARMMLFVPPHSSEQIIGNIYYTFPNGQVFVVNSLEAFHANNATMVKEQVYRIADALDLEVVPAGLTWTALEDSPDISLPEFELQPNGDVDSYDYIPEHYYPEKYQGNIYAATAYSALFEASAASSAYRFGAISNSEFDLVTATAYTQWSQAQTVSHYTGEHLGPLTPVLPTSAFPDLLYDPSEPYTSTGASTEGFTLIEFEKIFNRKGITTAGRSATPESGDLYGFELNRGLPSLSSQSQVKVGQPYKDSFVVMVKRYVTGRGVTETIHERSPRRKENPNYMGFTRLYSEDPSFVIKNVGDGHLNQHGSMLMASSLYTIMTGGDHPFLDGAVDMDQWSGPQRFVASIGYGTVMGAGRLVKLELPPVSIGQPRHYLQRETSNPITLSGFDFDGIPVSVEILSPPQFGSLVFDGATDPTLTGVSGGTFLYTPQAGFDGLDSLTYRVVNANGASQPLTVHLSVGPYEPVAPVGAVILEEDFDDMDVSDWSLGPNYEFTTSPPPLSWLGVPQPYDGIAALRLWDYEPAEKAIDTTAFENLELTIRVGVGEKSHGLNVSGDMIASVEWYDGTYAGTGWHPLITHVMDEVNNGLLQTYTVSLPEGAADNPDFRLRISGTTNGNDRSAAYFDSIRLTGDIIPRAPVVEDGEAAVAMNDSVEIELIARDQNPFDVLTYTLVDPSNGVLSGVPPLVTYTPNPDFTGTDSFLFSVNDGTFDSGYAQVTITVRDNTAPVVDAGEDRVVHMTTGPFWTPEYAMPAGWYDASDTNSIVHAGGLVSQWQDKSGNGLHLNQTIASGQPITGQTLNGLNAIGFSDDWLTTDSNPFGTAVEDAFVMVVNRINSRRDGYLFSLTGESAAEVWCATVPNRLGWVQFLTGGTSGSNRITADGSLDMGTMSLMSFYGSTTDNVQQYYLNGSYNTGDTSGHSVAVSGPIVFGKSESNDFQDSTVGEVVIINGTVSQQTRQNLEGYLAHKWGLAAELPEDHPFKDSPPGGPYATFDLLGVVSDGENDPLMTEWTQISGPGQAEFSSTTDTVTTVTLLDPGTYVFRLTSDDGLAVTVDEVTITIPAPMVDLDGDGLNDAWETEHFPGQEAIIDGTLDSDGDGVKDFIEFLTGTDPNIVDAPQLALQAGRSAHGPSSVFKWTVKEGFVAGQHYEVMYSTDLSGWFTLPPEHYTVTPRPVGGMTDVEMQVTHDYGDHIFITLDRP